MPKLTPKKKKERGIYIEL